MLSGGGAGAPFLVSERKLRSGGEGQLAQGYKGSWCRPGSGGLSLCLLCDLPCWPLGCCPSFSCWRIPAQAPSTSFLRLIPPVTRSCNSDHHQHACESPLETSSLDSELQPVCPAAFLAREHNELDVSITQLFGIPCWSRLGLCACTAKGLGSVPGQGYPTNHAV